jgi:hypothetical protein
MLPTDVPHPRTLSDERLAEVMRIRLQEERDGTVCACRTCREFNAEADREAERRGITGLPS